MNIVKRENMQHINIALDDFFKSDYEITSLEYDLVCNEDFSITSLVYVYGYYINDDMEDVEIMVTYHIKNDEILFKKITLI